MCVIVLYYIGIKANSTWSTNQILHLLRRQRSLTVLQGSTSYTLFSVVQPCKMSHAAFW